MNSSESLTRAVLIFIKVSISSLLLFQVSSCDLEVIPPIEPITSNFTYGVQDPNCTANCIVSFTSTSENATSYEWDFGDASTVSTLKDPQHTYATAGKYNVQLIAKATALENDTTKIEVNVGIPSAALKADFTFALQDPNCTANCLVTFTNKSENATSYLWDFGDGGTTSNLKDPQHTYSTGGNYTVTLTSTKGMESKNASKTVIITSPAQLTAFRHTVNATNMDQQRTTLDYTDLNNNKSKIIVVSRVLVDLGIRNTAAVGMYYLSNKWTIFNQDKVAMKLDEIFNVVVADVNDPNAFVHQTSTANLTDTYVTVLNHPSVNDKPNARVFVTPIWETFSDFNDHPLGVVYLNNRWHIVNLDQASLPAGLKFNVIVGHDDATSFTHITTFQSTVGDYTTIDHASTNGKPNTKVISTTNLHTSLLPINNPRTIGVWYAGGLNKWTIFNENGDSMQQLNAYNVLAIE